MANKTPKNGRPKKTAFTVRLGKPHDEQLKAMAADQRHSCSLMAAILLEEALKEKQA